MSDFISGISKSLGLPSEEIEKNFSELKFKGLIFTPAKTAKEFSTGKYPVRLAFMPPSNSSKSNSVTFGPFCIKPKAYKGFTKVIKDRNAFQVMLAFIRLEYETTGGGVQQYSFQANDDDLNEFVSLIGLWDIDNPVAFDHVFWVVPKDKCREFLNSRMKKKFKPSNYKWWDVRVELGDSLISKKLQDYPEAYGLMPTKLAAGSWARYLPTTAYYTLLVLYSKATRGGKFKSFDGLNQILPLIDEILESDVTIRETKAESSMADRELLIKELCNYNSLPYPVDSKTMLDYLCKLGFILVSLAKHKLIYSLQSDISNPSRVLKFPDGWKERFEKFLVTGTVLFSYLNHKEALKD